MKCRTATSSTFASTFKLSLFVFLFVFNSTMPLSAQVVINEIMWAESQYVELYNNSTAVVGLDNWSLHNEDGLITTFSASTLLADGYFLIEVYEASTTIPADHLSPLTLSVISGNTLFLKDDSGDTVDTANQAGGGWFAGVQLLSGISMERINADVPGTVAANWGDSSGTSGGRRGTPRAVNSVSTTPQPVFLISRVNFKNSPDWVEVRCLDDGNGGNGLDLNGCYLTDLGSPDKVIGNALIKTGETLKITYNSSAADESSSAAGNQDGILDLFTTTNGLVSTDEQVVFVNAADEFLDAVSWSDGALSPAEADDLNELYLNGQWQSDIAADCVNSQLVTAGYLIERAGEVDTNSAADWRIEAMGQSTTTGNSSPAEAPQDINRINDFKISRKLVWLDHEDRQKRQTLICFSLVSAAKTSALIYDSSGRLVRRLKTGETLPSGENQLSWRGRNEADNQVTVGIYILYLKVSNAYGADEKTATIVVGRKP